ncbi:uncharacterized protein LOC126708215 [Quercus robur]|uniref:uncharacterized protein LOC126708215 n=1 Tax=Quercus robur TaxID=38942 RepID=UPI0021635A52|nr:uncharacterized protein LOC126708215 [Quercus robur]
MGEIDMRRGLISSVLINGKVIHIPGNPVSTKTVHIHGNPVSTETIRVHGDPDGIGTGHAPMSQGNAEIAHVYPPTFNSYDRKIDLVKHVSHYIQMMSLHTHNDTLMCKVFPSSLGPTALRWFNGLRKGSIHSFSELIQEFGIRFVTYSRVPQPVDALLFMKMRAGETLRSYASWYWELYNEIGGDNEMVATSTFRIGLPEDSGLRESLTKKPPEDMRIVDWIKYEPYFRWPNKMGGDPSRRNQNLYCTYHRDKGHTIKQYRVLKDHLGQLVKVGYLKEFVLDSGDRGVGQDTRQRGNPLPPPIGVIEVIHAALERLIAGRRKGVLIVVQVESYFGVQPPEKRMRSAWEPITFDDDDLEGMIQLHDDALVVTARIIGFLVKRVMVDQGSGADVMYPDLFKGLRLKKKDLAKYSSPLVGSMVR